MTDLEKALAHAILRWYKARNSPRADVTAAERNLARVAEALQKAG